MVIVLVILIFTLLDFISSKIAEDIPSTEKDDLSGGPILESLVSYTAFSIMCCLHLATKLKNFDATILVFFSYFDIVLIFRSLF